MMTKALYMEDAYLQTFAGRVIAVEGKQVELDQTTFYPKGGGQPSDEGIIETIKGEQYKVSVCTKKEGRILHEVDREGILVGDGVKGTINWERRYKLMRMHTAAHLLASVVNKETGALITGNELGIDKSRIDFSLEKFDPAQSQQYVQKANEIAQQDLQINHYWMERNDAEKDPTLFKLAKEMPAELTRFRIVEIWQVDKQADGGTHVGSTREIGMIKYVSADNKGKDRRRIYFSLE
jgi:Ser-tRNA(Ala) deacylase AlaX